MHAAATCDSDLVSKHLLRFASTIDINGSTGYCTSMSSVSKSSSSKAGDLKLTHSRDCPRKKLKTSIDLEHPC